MPLQECNTNRRACDRRVCRDMDRIYLARIRELCLLGVCILVNAFATHFMRNRLVNIFSREGHSLYVPLSVDPLCEPRSLLSLLLLGSHLLCLTRWLCAATISKREIQFLIHFHNIRKIHSHNIRERNRR